MKRNLNDIITANKTISNIQHIIKKSIDKATYDKHFRAVIDIVNIDGTADIKLFDSDVVIPNVKVRNELDLEADDEVYILAINGNINNIIVDINISTLGGTPSEYISPESTITPQIVNLDGDELVFYAATETGDIFTNNGKCIVFIKNESGSSIELTVDNILPCDESYDHDIVVTIPDGETIPLGLFPKARYNVNKNLYLYYSDHTNIYVAVLNTNVSS